MALALGGCGSDSTDEGTESEAEAEAEAEAESESEGESNVTCTGDVEGGTEITVSGTIVDALNDNRVAGATIEVYDDADALLCEGTGGGDGTYAITMAIAKAGFSGRLHIEAATYWAANIFSLATPITEDRADLEILMVSESAAEIQATLLGIEPDDTKGLAGMIVQSDPDDATSYLAGAVIDLEPADYEVRVYLGASGFPDESLTATSSAGTVVFANVDPGSYSGVATVDDAEFGTTLLEVYAKEFSGAVILPADE
ncbi:MAG: hypothetical protein AABZ30_07955 [Myxococcota bacterium]